jgi:antitoxin component YwqK of YwqJK toxin-antitoxin module
MGDNKLLISLVGVLLIFSLDSFSQEIKKQPYCFASYWDSFSCCRITERVETKNGIIGMTFFYNRKDSLIEKRNTILSVKERDSLLQRSYKLRMTYPQKKSTEYKFFNEKGQLICQSIMVKHAQGDVDRYKKQWYENNQLKVSGVEKKHKYKIKRWRIDGTLISCARQAFLENEFGSTTSISHGWQKIWYPSGKLKYKILYDRNHVTRFMFFENSGRLKERKKFSKEEAVYLVELLENKDELKLLYLAPSCVDKCEEPGIDAYIYTKPN